MNNALSCFKKSALFISILSSIAATNTFAADDTGFIAGSETKVNFRYRFENVDQDGQTNDAQASTLRSRISFKSGEVSHFRLNAEVDNVTTIGADDYNDASGFRSNTGYPVVADPTGTSLNQLNLTYKNDGTSVTLGRQRINLNNQRFVGGVAWRQNEQTYDGIRGQHSFNDALSVDYSYIYYVSRIFGPDGPKRGLDGDFHFINAHYKLNKDHKFTGFAYLLEDDSWANSNDTYGIDYNGKFGSLKAHASFATQSNGDFDANYFAIDGTMKLAMFNVTVGLEQLGSDNGNYGFSTPLATAHKFQGFADKFLGTPKTGVKDYYSKIATKIGPVAVAGFYHQFDAVEGDQNYGSEIDLVATYKVHKTTTLLAKYADYNADDLATDTQKFWLMANVNFSL
ncbi:alginate export family protein [Parashewanella spongiae]|nr:alginate export family protein [Parashewanella spongiae]MCL1077629.1 alginate export family protein [Parashewanella spongiae]